jgi:hypothetical protein
MKKIFRHQLFYAKLHAKADSLEMQITYVSHVVFSVIHAQVLAQFALLAWFHLKLLQVFMMSQQPKQDVWWKMEIVHQALMIAKL